MKRVPVQLFSHAGQDGPMTLVLASDGSLWHLSESYEGARWTAVPPIPDHDVVDELTAKWRELQGAMAQQAAEMDRQGEELRKALGQIADFHERGPWVPAAEHIQDVQELEERMRNLVKINQQLEARLGGMERPAPAKEPRKKARTAK